MRTAQRLVDKGADELRPLPLEDIAHEEVRRPIVGLHPLPVGQVEVGVVTEGENLARGPTIIPTKVLAVGGQALHQPGGLGLRPTGRVEHDAPVVDDEVREFVRRQVGSAVWVGPECPQIEVEHLPSVAVRETDRQIHVPVVEAAVYRVGGVVEVIDEDGDAVVAVDAGVRLGTESRGQRGIDDPVELAPQIQNGVVGQLDVLLHIDHDVIAHIPRRGLDGAM